MSVQFGLYTYPTPIAITNNTTPSLISTINVLNAALSRIPITKITVTMARMQTAGRFMNALACENGSWHQRSGTTQDSPKQTRKNSLKYFDHDAATVAQLMAYSRIKSQPMIQASNSPSVA